MKITTLSDPIWQSMTSGVVAVSPDTLTDDIKILLEENSFHHLPVVDSAGKLMGIISSKDMERINWLRGLWQLNDRVITAEDIMTDSPVVLSPDDTIAEAIEVFLDNNFHAVPILNGDILLGIITTHDILEITKTLKKP